MAVAGWKSRVVVRESGCHEFTGCLDNSGYGKASSGGVIDRTHRISWREHHGAIPDGMCVLHKCDNRKCVNPDHLFVGTKKDNCDDMMRKGRGRKAQGSEHHIAKFTEQDIERIREAHLFGARQVDLAAVYGVHQTCISRITRRAGWRHVA